MIPYLLSLEARLVRAFSYLREMRRYGNARIHSLKIQNDEYMGHVYMTIDRKDVIVKIL